MTGVVLAAVVETASAQQQAPIEVLDADTVRQAGVTWRIVGIDAPEIQHARCASERHAGIIAAAHLLAVLGERGGTIEPVGNPSARDKWRRRLGRLLIGGKGGEEWSSIAIRDGLAVAYDGRSRRPDWCTK